MKNIESYNIRLARIKAQLSQVALAEIMGVSKDTIKNWENAERHGWLKNVYRYAVKSALEAMQK